MDSIENNGQLKQVTCIIKGCYMA